MTEATIIIAVYNHWNWLRVILDALGRQSVRDFEVVVADDGSKPEIGLNIEQLRPQLPFAIKHVWHEDRGWRKNIILNRAVEASCGKVIIFLDGDCVPHQRFVEDHLAAHRSCRAFSGRRAEIPAVVSAMAEAGEISTLPRLKRALRRHFVATCRTHRPFRYVRLPLVGGKLLAKRRRHAILGCNFSIDRPLLLELNGFDERYLAPGWGEDSDVDLRLENMGVDVLVAGHNALVYHRCHKHFDLNYPENIALLEENRKGRVTRTPHGIIKEQR